MHMRPSEHITQSSSSWFTSARSGKLLPLSKVFHLGQYSVNIRAVLSALLFYVFCLFLEQHLRCVLQKGDFGACLSVSGQTHAPKFHLLSFAAPFCTEAVAATITTLVGLGKGWGRELYLSVKSYASTGATNSFFCDLFLTHGQKLSLNMTRHRGDYSSVI